MTDTSPSKDRLLSLDFFRGLTMFLLIAEFTTLFNHFRDPSVDPGWVVALIEQFHHHPWNGLRFWDLIQPFFMFIVGVAMPISISNRKKRGQSPTDIRNHVFRRAFLLLLFGWGLYCIGPGEIVFKFQNVLAQLSVTYLIAYFLMHRSHRMQIVFSLGLLLMTELIYRFFPVEGFNHPFTKLENFGTWLDLQYGGADMGGGWVSFNAIPTAAHTIWGVVAGQLLMSERTAREKLKALVIAGVVGVVVGYALDPITPIIKRISTSSFVIVSGGWTLLSLALCYWLIDIKKWKGSVWFFAIVGMNPLFIYLFAHLGGAPFIRQIIEPFSNGLLGWMGPKLTPFVTSAIVLFALWYICYWLYKKRVFFRI